MAGITFSPKATVIPSSWLNAINDFFYDLFQSASTVQEARDALGIGTATVTTLAGTSHTLVVGNADSILVATNAGGCTITIPTNDDAAFPVGSTLVIAQGAASQVGVEADGGVTLHCAGTPETRAQYSVIGLAKVGTDTWYLTGDYTA